MNELISCIKNLPKHLKTALQNIWRNGVMFNFFNFCSYNYFVINWSNWNTCFECSRYEL